MDRSEWQEALGAARRGDSVAQHDAGVSYRDGIESADGTVVVRSSTRNARIWLRRAAEQGLDSAQHELANLLTTGGTTEAEFLEAIGWYKKAVAAGNAAAAHDLGAAYRDMGRHRQAYQWYLRSVRMGEVSSALEVGLCQYFGVGVRRDEASAVRAFRSVVEAGTEVSEREIEYAHYWIGIAHLCGRGAARSVLQARTHLEFADQDFDHEAASLLLWVTGRTAEAMK